MITLTASLHLLTPAFLGGANHAADQVRLTALKSALRWWWRAHRWSHLRAHTDGQSRLNMQTASQKLWTEEMALFGSASRTDENGVLQGGQGTFVIRLLEAPNASCVTWGAATANDWKPHGRNSGLAYLLGQGLWNRTDFAPQRSAIAPGDFTVELLFRPAHAARTHLTVCNEVSEIAQALWLLCHFGGLGARARRGWGSLLLNELHLQGLGTESEEGILKQHLPAKDPVALAQMLKHILPNKLDKEYPPLTAFSALSCIKTVRYGNSIPADELDAAGRDFQTFRKSFSAYDVELIKVFAKGSQPSTHPQRAVFGLGHNYYIPPNATQSSISVGIQPAASGDRRASPLLLHLHRWPSTGILAMAYTLLPAKFLPNGENLNYVDQNRKRGPVAVPKQTDNDTFWQPANEFLASLHTSKNAGCTTILSSITHDKKAK